MRVLIAGAGSMGSLIASYISDTTKVWLLGRSWHLNPIQQRGYLELVTPNEKREKIEFKPSQIVTKPIELHKKFDVIFITVKAYDTKQILQSLKSVGVSAECYVLFQNGLGNETVAREIIAPTKVLLRGITTNGAHIPSPGIVAHAGKGGTKFGSLSKNYKEWGQQLVTLFRESGLPAEYVENMPYLVWEKLAINAVINPLTALLNVKNKAIYKLPELRTIGKRILNEIKDVAEEEDISLEHIQEKVFQVAKKTGENRSSMLQDLNQKKKTEIGFINEAIVKKAKEKGIRAPFNQLLSLLIRGKEKIIKDKSF